MIENKIVKPEIDIDEIKIQKENILKLLGYQVNEQEDIIEKTVKNLIDNAITSIHPKAGYIIIKKEVLGSKETLKIGDITLKIGKIISSQLKKADYLAIFICTIGDLIEKSSTEMMKKNEILEGYIMNLIGSEASESMAEIVYHKIGETCKNSGLNVTNRYSPGYCNWNVEEQFKLFSFFPENFCGISLTESALMYPVKSVSGIMGIGKGVVMKPYKCSVCNDENCIYRNKL